MIPEKAMKLLTLALDPAAQKGEIESAALKFVALLRGEGITAFELFSGLPSSGKPMRNDHRESSARSSFVFPFGKWKGVPLRQIESAYLLWVLENLTKISPVLRMAIIAELNQRRDAK